VKWLGTTDAAGFFRPSPWFAALAACLLLAPWVAGVCFLIRWAMR
jgi:hypothetical protein